MSKDESAKAGLMRGFGLQAGVSCPTWRLVGRRPGDHRKVRHHSEILFAAGGQHVLSRDHFRLVDSNELSDLLEHGWI